MLAGGKESFQALLRALRHRYNNRLETREEIKGLKAESCIQCGECETKCPQHISIVDQLEEVARVLGGEE